MFAKHFIIILWIYITKAEVKEKPDNKMVPKRQSGRESRTLGHIAGKVLKVTLKISLLFHRGLHVGKWAFIRNGT